MTSILIAIYILICVIVGTWTAITWNDDMSLGQELSLPWLIVVGLLAALIGTPIIILLLALCLVAATLPELLICATLIFLFA